MYLDSELIRTLLIQAMLPDESSRAVATLFAEIEYPDSDTALASLQDFIEIWYEDSQAAMSLLQFTHQKLAKAK